MCGGLNDLNHSRQTRNLYHSYILTFFLYSLWKARRREAKCLGFDEASIVRNDEICRITKIGSKRSE